MHRQVPVSWPVGNNEVHAALDLQGNDQDCAAASGAIRFKSFLDRKHHVQNDLGNVGAGWRSRLGMASTRAASDMA
jgi:hypothetical protein